MKFKHSFAVLLVFAFVHAALGDGSKEDGGSKEDSDSKDGSGSSSNESGGDNNGAALPECNENGDLDNCIEAIGKEWQKYIHTVFLDFKKFQELAGNDQDNYIVYLLVYYEKEIIAYFAEFHHSFYLSIRAITSDGKSENLAEIVIRIIIRMIEVSIDEISADDSPIGAEYREKLVEYYRGYLDYWKRLLDWSTSHQSEANKLFTYYYTIFVKLNDNKSIKKLVAKYGSYDYEAFYQLVGNNMEEVFEIIKSLYKGIQDSTKKEFDEIKKYYESTDEELKKLIEERNQYVENNEYVKSYLEFVEVLIKYVNKPSDELKEEVRQKWQAYLASIGIGDGDGGDGGDGGDDDEIKKYFEIIIKAFINNEELRTYLESLTANLKIAMQSAEGDMRTTIGYYYEFFEYCLTIVQTGSTDGIDYDKLVSLFKKMDIKVTIKLMIKWLEENRDNEQVRAMFESFTNMMKILLEDESVVQLIQKYYAEFTVERFWKYVEQYTGGGDGGDGGEIKKYLEIIINAFIQNGEFVAYLQSLTENLQIVMQSAEGDMRETLNNYYKFFEYTLSIVQRGSTDGIDYDKWVSLFKKMDIRGTIKVVMKWLEQNRDNEQVQVMFESFTNMMKILLENESVVQLIQTYYSEFTVEGFWKYVEQYTGGGDGGDDGEIKKYLEIIINAFIQNREFVTYLQSLTENLQIVMQSAEGDMRATLSRYYEFFKYFLSIVQAGSTEGIDYDKLVSLFKEMDIRGTIKVVMKWLEENRDNKEVQKMFESFMNMMKILLENESVVQFIRMYYSEFTVEGFWKYVEQYTGGGDGGDDGEMNKYFQEITQFLFKNQDLKEYFESLTSSLQTIIERSDVDAEMKEIFTSYYEFFSYILSIYTSGNSDDIDYEKLKSLFEKMDMHVTIQKVIQWVIKNPIDDDAKKLIDSLTYILRVLIKNESFGKFIELYCPDFNSDILWRYVGNGSNEDTWRVRGI